MSRSEEPMPTVKAIHKYWYDMVVNTTDVELSTKIGDSAFENILEGGGECCYACGREGRVQRCHIIPDMLGGSMEPSNLFLMCRECHQDNPDTIYEDIFFHFVKNRDGYVDRDIKEMWKEVNLLYKHSNKEDKECYEYVQAIPHQELIDTINNIDYMSKVGIGLNNKMSMASKSGVVWKTLLEIGEQRKILSD